MKPKTFHLSHGLTLMVTPKKMYLCFNPNPKENDRAAREMWAVHTEERLRQNVALRLFSNSNTLLGYPIKYYKFDDDEYTDPKDIVIGPPLI